MPNKITEFIELTLSAFQKQLLTKLIFSRPRDNAPKKAVCRLCSHRGRNILAVEYSLPGDTVSQKNIQKDGISDFLTETIPEYLQINLITTLGEAELKYSKQGEPLILGGDRLMRKMSGETAGFIRVPDSLMREKKYILTGKEDFLIKLGISDKNGRVHDKKQGKFRQINKFLEYIEGVYRALPAEGEIRIYDLCCGKSYLSFAVYYYLTKLKGRDVYMLGIDLKRDVMDFCQGMANEMGFSGMHFISDNIENTPADKVCHMVISLHACDIATDIVLKNAVRLGADVILSTPCCHKHLSDMITAEPLGFVTKYPLLRGKLCEAITDALRLEYLLSEGYEVSGVELTDPDDTPKNTLLRAIRKAKSSEKKKAEYEELLKFIIGDKYKEYLPF